MTQRRALIAAAVAAVLAVPGAALVAAQQKRASPHDTVKAVIDGGNVPITYGRPFAKGRKIFGGLVPYGQVWRTGADEATILETDKMLMLGPLHLNPGKYSLYSLVDDKTWKLVVNKQVGQWGTEYQQGQDLGRVDMKVETLAAAGRAVHHRPRQGRRRQGRRPDDAVGDQEGHAGLHHDVSARLRGTGEGPATARALSLYGRGPTAPTCRIAVALRFGTCPTGIRATSFIVTASTTNTALSPAAAT